MVSKHPWLEDLDEAQAMNFVNDLTDFVCRPAFGARPKREIELRIFYLLYGKRLTAGTLSVAKVSSDLAISRARAKSLMLDVRARQIAQDDVDVADLLGEAVRRWPQQGQIERDGDRLRLVIDDPFLRDVLKNHAFREGIVIDGSFSGEIVRLSWASYSLLLQSLIGDTKADEVFRVFAAEVRKKLADNAEATKDLNATLKKMQKEKRSRAEKFKEVATTAAPYAGLTAKVATTAAAL